jgi:hypothetical protein
MRTMHTCSIEGVHPSILSAVGGLEVAEALKVILGKKPYSQQHFDSSPHYMRIQKCMQ